MNEGGSEVICRCRTGEVLLSVFLSTVTRSWKLCRVESSRALSLIEKCPGPGPERGAASCRRHDIWPLYYKPAAGGHPDLWTTCTLRVRVRMYNSFAASLILFSRRMISAAFMGTSPSRVASAYSMEGMSVTAWRSAASSRLSTALCRRVSRSCYAPATFRFLGSI